MLSVDRESELVRGLIFGGFGDTEIAPGTARCWPFVDVGLVRFARGQITTGDDRLLGGKTARYSGIEDVSVGETGVALRRALMGRSSGSTESSPSESDDRDKTLLLWRSRSPILALVRLEPLDVRVCRLETLAPQSAGDSSSGGLRTAVTGVSTWVTTMLDGAPGSGDLRAGLPKGDIKPFEVVDNGGGEICGLSGAGGAPSSSRGTTSRNVICS